MEQKTFSAWLKCIVAGIGLCGLAIYALVIPLCGIELRASYPEYAFCLWPWLIFIWVTGIPCYAALIYAWRIVASIGLDKSFTDENALYFKRISVLAAADAAFFIVGNVVFLLLGMNHPGIVLAAFVIVFVGVAVSIASAALSHLVKKAADLQEQSEFTI